MGLLCFIAIACGPGDRQRNAQAAAENQVLPVIDRTPSLTITIPDSIGGASADMGDVVRLARGDIAIADWDGHRLLVFDSVGALRRVIGREGSGPGEFEAPLLIQAFGGDSLLIWDPYLGRLSWIDANSGAGRSVNLSSAGLIGGSPIVGMLRDGRVIGRREVLRREGAMKLPTRTATFLLLGPDGARARTVADTFVLAAGDARGYRFFQPTLQTATDGQRLFAGISSEWRIAIYAPDGHRLGELSRPWTPRVVTAEVRARIRASLTRPSMAPEFLDDDRFDATVPAFGRILPADDGSIWVLDYAAPYESPDSASVFSHDGAFLGAVALPPHFRPSVVGADHIIGTATREDGDLEIRMYRLLN
jgi:hypothetical protein